MNQVARWIRTAFTIVFALMLTGNLFSGGTREADPAEPEQVVTHALMAGDIGNLDPTGSWVSVEAPIITMVMEGLVDYPPGEVSDNFQPALAESWDMSADGTKFTFYLRRGVQWHGGYGEFTAHDVKFSLDRYRNPDVSAWYNEYRDIKDVTILDDYTVEVVIAEPDPFFLAKVATNTMSASMMLSQAAFEDRGSDGMRTSAIGTGPFKFESYRSQDSVVLVRNDDYWGGTPRLDRVRFVFMPDQSSREIALRTGEIDSMRTVTDAVAIERLIDEGFVLDSFGPEIVWWLHIDTTVEPLDDIRVRRAIAHAVNPKDLETFMGSQTTSVSESLMPSTYFGAASKDELPEGWTGYDPEKSRRLLAEAGYPNGFTIDGVLITQRADYRQQMEIIQEHLAQVGIRVPLNPVDHTYYHSQIRQGVSPLVMYGEISYPDTNIFLQRFFKSTGTVANFSKFSDPRLDELIDEIALTADFEKRRDMLIEAQRIIAEAAIVVPTTYTAQPLFRRPELHLGYELKSSLILNHRFNQHSWIER